MSHNDAFNLRVIALALDNAEDAAKRLEYNCGRELVQASFKRLRDELRIYGKRSERARLQ